MVKSKERYRVTLTASEISALLGTSGNADAHAMAEDFDSEAEGEAFLAALQRATDKLNRAKPVQASARAALTPKVPT